MRRQCNGHTYENHDNKADALHSLKHYVTPCTVDVNCCASIEVCVCNPSIVVGTS